MTQEIPAHLMPDRRRACIRCKHFVAVTEDCGRDQKLYGYNPVTGAAVYSPPVKAGLARLPGWDCGPLGVLWED